MRITEKIFMDLSMEFNCLIVLTSGSWLCMGMGNMATEAIATEAATVVATDPALRERGTSMSFTSCQLAEFPTDLIV